MKIEPRFHEALAATEPLAEFRKAVREQLAAGRTREDITRALDRLRTMLKESGRDHDEDLVLEVLDLLAGWCSPHMKL